MVKIYIVRHCEAEGNRANIFQGSTDCDISELGEIQLSFLKERFRDIHIDKAFSSPLIRACKTAKKAVEGKGIEVKTEPDFTEIYGGILEGKNFNKSFEDNPELAYIWDNRPEDFCPEGAEPMRQVYERVFRGLERLATDPENEGKTLLIASHGAAIRCLICRMLYGRIEELSKTPWSINTAVSLIIYENGKYNLEFHGDFSHLPEEYMPKKLRILSVKKEDYI